MGNDHSTVQLWTKLSVV